MLQRLQVPALLMLCTPGHIALFGAERAAAPRRCSPVRWLSSIADLSCIETSSTSP